MNQKYHVSQILGIQSAHHSQLDFVDINIRSDQKLFIDPALIFSNTDRWCKDASATINSFFDEFYDAYRKANRDKKLNLLAHANEVNYTKLGYGNGRNGNGNTAEGLMKDFKKLDSLVKDIQSISSVVDLPVLIAGFNEDGLSDLITNVIHLNLNTYTLEMMKLFGVEPNATDTFDTWDSQTLSWVTLEKPCYKHDEQKILLTPKRIVRKKYLFSADHFLQRVILERQKEATAYKKDNGKIGYKKTKKQLKNQILKTDKNWRYTYVHNEAKSDLSLLKEYHDRLEEYYFGKGISDEMLDAFIYGQSN